MDQSNLSLIEWIFLGAAVVVTIPILIFAKVILKELKNEPPEKSTDA